MFFGSLLSAVLLAGQSAKSIRGGAFFTYIHRPDPAYRYTAKLEGADGTFNLTSQIWQGNEWNHTIVYRQPTHAACEGVAVLFITGNGPNGNEKLLLPSIVKSTELPVAMLFNIPNQPLYGLSEDDLIAYTFDQYLSTDDASWPLLFPMTKSVLRAMDAIQAATKKTDHPIHRFIISGASKRGWTTWLTGASGDRRVVAIAPMVIDNLNLGKQMKHQMEIWGKYSDQIEAYTKRGLQAKFVSPEGRRLAEMVDPYSYRSQIKVPTLIVTGANDPYWAADASSQYYDDLKEPKWIVTVPNVGHNLGGGAEAIETLGAFCHAIAGQSKMPNERWHIFEDVKGHVKINLDTKGLSVRKLTVWMAQSHDLDFKSSKYLQTAVYEANPGERHIQVGVDLPANGNAAVFGEVTYGKGKTFRLCSTTTIFRSGS